LAYYGDDFTGSTDMLESVSTGGVETVMFVEPPTKEQLQRYAHVRAIGVAGRSRMMTPDEMEASLPRAFGALSALRPRFVHYKVSSTFDSSPEVGSIGRAIEIGQRVFRNRFVPLVVGAPSLQRFCVFGNLFARSGLDSAPFRLDRHPTMRHHPVTPMTEADLRVTLSRQTQRPVALIDVLTLDAGYDAVRKAITEATGEAGTIVLFDTLTHAHLALIGRVICELQQQDGEPMFVAGSSGMGHALTSYWQSIGIVRPHPCTEMRTSKYAPMPVDRTIVLSGSCSPVTERQIAWARRLGFVELQIDTARLHAADELNSQIADIISRCRTELDAGHSVIIHTNGAKRGSSLLASAGANGGVCITAEQIGALLGRVLLELLNKCEVRRVAVAGGDTSGYVARTLSIEALEMAGQLEPGAPLCVARSNNAVVDGLEITFKGGQVGHDEFFGTLLRGRSNRQTAGV
jgi:uncharacterized protein YgbK (DUF1537 family)